MEKYSKKSHDKNDTYIPYKESQYIGDRDKDKAGVKKRSLGFKYPGKPAFSTISP